jgi:hypothetical protein
MVLLGMEKCMTFIDEECGKVDMHCFILTVTNANIAA